MSYGIDRFVCPDQGPNCLQILSADIKSGCYEGHPISSDNGLISQKLLLKSEFYYPLHAELTMTQHVSHLSI